MSFNFKQQPIGQIANLDSDPNLDLDSDVLSQVLWTCRPIGYISQLVICLATKYTHELGQFAIRYAGRHLKFLPSRTGPPAPTKRDDTIKYRDIIAHLLRLTAKDRTHTDRDICLLADRANLRAAHAVLLVQLHANTISRYSSGSLFDLEDVDDCAEEYESYEAFQSVVQARHEAREAIRELRAAGGDLECELTCRLNSKPIEPYVALGKAPS